MTYEYLVELMPPGHMSKEYPAALYRRGVSSLFLEAVNRQGKWIEAPESTEEYLLGQIDLILVSEDTARKAVKNVLPNLSDIDSLFN
jgi:hypothetical protein